MVQSKTSKQGVFVKNNATRVPESGRIPIDNVWNIFREKGKFILKNGKHTQPSSTMPKWQQWQLRQRMPGVVSLSDAMKKIWSRCFPAVTYGSMDENDAFKVDEIWTNAGFVVQKLPAKKVLSGSGNATGRGWALFLISDRDVVREVLIEEYGDIFVKSMEDNLTSQKKLQYMSMLLGNKVSLPDMKIHLKREEGYGRAYIRRSKWKKIGLAYGTKMTGTLKEMLYPASNTKMRSLGAGRHEDIVLWEDGLKIPCELDWLGKHLYYNPDGNASVRAGKKETTLKFRFLIQQKMEPKADISFHEKTFRTGKIADTVKGWKLFSYLRKDGTWGIKSTLLSLLISAKNYITDKMVRKEAMAAITRDIYRSWWAPSGGKVGVLCDIEDLPDKLPDKMLVCIFYPNTRPILCQVKISKKHGLIGVPLDVLLAEGRDLDGDLVLAAIPKCFKTYIKVGEIKFTPPTPMPSEDKGMLAAWARDIDSHALIGRVDRMSDILMSVARSLDWSDTEVLQLATTCYEKVEEILTSFKHGERKETPSLEDWAKDVGLGNKLDMVTREAEFCRLINFNNLDGVEKFEHNIDGGVTITRVWEKIRAMKPKDTGAFFENRAFDLRSITIPEHKREDLMLDPRMLRLEKLRSSSFSVMLEESNQLNVPRYSIVLTASDSLARLKSIENELKSKDELEDILLLAIMKNDRNLVNSIMESKWPMMLKEKGWITREK